MAHQFHESHKTGVCALCDKPVRDAMECQECGELVHTECAPNAHVCPAASGDAAMGSLKELETVEATVESTFTGGSFEPLSFEEAVKILKTPHGDEVVASCKEKAQQLRKFGSVPASLTDEDLQLRLLYTYDNLGKSPKETNPYRFQREALIKRTIPLLWQFRGMLWGLLRALRRLPRVEHDELYRGIQEHVQLSDPRYTPGALLRWPTFNSTTTKIDVARRFAGGGGTVFVVKGSSRHGVKPWGYELKNISMYPDEFEVLTEPDLCFRVVSVNTKGYQSEVVLEALKKVNA